MQYLLFLIFPLALARMEPGYANRFDPDILMRAMGVPMCIRKCVDPLMAQVATLWDLRNIVQKARPLCRSHSEAMQCLQRNPSCDVHQMFKTTAGAIEKMCGERAPLFEKMRPCLERYADGPVQFCDAKCRGRSTVMSFLNDPVVVRASKSGGDILAVSGQIGPLCSVLQCELPCITLELNKVCPLSGWLTLDALLQPLDFVADKLLNTSPSLKEFVEKKLDRRCHFIVQKKELLKLRKGQFRQNH